MQILSYVLSAIGLICMISASLIKGEKMKAILVLVCCGNALVATSYLIGGAGINGAASCYLGALQTLINYFFDKKGRALPIWLIVAYAVAFIVCNLLVGGFTALCLLAMVASLTFIMSIGQKSGARYRFWTIVNIGLWCLYDILSHSYGALITHIPLLLFTVIGMLIYDIRKAKAEIND